MERPEALATLHSMINGSSNFLASARNMTTDSPDGLFTQVELDTLERVINETQVYHTTFRTRMRKKHLHSSVFQSVENSDKLTK